MGYGGVDAGPGDCGGGETCPVEDGLGVCPWSGASPWYEGRLYGRYVRVAVPGGGAGGVADGTAWWLCPLDGGGEYGLYFGEEGRFPMFRGAG